VDSPESRRGIPRATEEPPWFSTPVFLGKNLLSLLSGALALIRQRPMLGCQRRKGGSRINVADRFSDTRECKNGPPVVLGDRWGARPGVDVHGWDEDIVRLQI
jgi:hypothetical protein